MITIIAWFFFVWGYMSFLNPYFLVDAVSVTEGVQITVPGYLFENDIMVDYLAYLMLENIAKPDIFYDYNSYTLQYVNEVFISQRPFFRTTEYETFGQFLKYIVEQTGWNLYPNLSSEQIHHSTLLGTLHKVYIDHEHINTFDYYIMDWGRDFYGFNFYNKVEAKTFLFDVLKEKSIIIKNK